ncbi:MAG TPA: PAS domain-containing protein, partial [Chitinophagaceae bacterium]|nr:PAS domain-containing protein [Chitinophagaceae bacterium]
RLIHANPALLHFLNIEKKDLNKKVTELVPEFIREKFFKAHLSVWASGIPCKKILVQPMADGTNNYFLINIYPFTNRYNKSLLVGEAFDITYSFQVQEEMIKANERLINLSKVTTEAIWEWDIETGYVFRNERLTRLIGSEDSNGFNSDWWYDLIHPEDRLRVRNKLESALKEKKSTWEHEFRMTNINGNYVTLHEQGFIIYKDGNAVKMFGSLRDITELKVLESRLIEGKVKQQKKLTEAMVRAQEKERIRLGNELHDNVNQLLAASKLFLDLVKTTDAQSCEFKAKVSEYIETACTEIRNLSHGLVVANFDQGGLIGSIEKILNDLSLSTTFRIAFKYDEKVESLSKSKKINLLRILQEQVKNVIKHSQATNIEVELSKINKHVQLHIKDNGIGFDPHKCRRGIGLSNIYDRARLNNGHVELNASPGMGCELKVIIPVNNK